MRQSLLLIRREGSDWSANSSKEWGFVLKSPLLVPFLRHTDHKFLQTIVESKISLTETNSVAKRARLICHGRSRLQRYVDKHVEIDMVKVEKLSNLSIHNLTTTFKPNQSKTMRLVFELFILLDRKRYTEEEYWNLKLISQPTRGTRKASPGPKSADFGDADQGKQK